MRTIAHISDLHFGREDPAVVEALRRDVLRARPDLLVVSGDLTQRARVDEFRQARAFLDSMPVARLVVPGNHDVPLDNVWRRLFHPYARYDRLITMQTRPVYRDEEMLVLGLDTTRPSRWKDGRMSRGQITGVRETFRDAAPDVFRVLVTHHPFLPPESSPRETLVGRADDALDALEESGADLLLAGHLHLGYSGDIRRHHVQRKRSILVAQAGTAVSTRRRGGEKNSYNVVRLAWPTLDIEIRESEGAAFRTRLRARYENQGGAWAPGIEQ